MRSSFQQLDRDGDGLISVADLAAVLQEGMPSLQGADAASRARSFDIAGALGFDEAAVAARERLYFCSSC